jgi:hypothetical protein
LLKYAYARHKWKCVCGATTDNDHCDICQKDAEDVANVKAYNMANPSYTELLEAKVNELTSSLNSYKDKLRESEVIREEFQYACNDAYHILYASYGGDSPVLKAPSPTQKASDILDKVLNYKYSLRSANEQLQPKH